MGYVAGAPGSGNVGRRAGSWGVCALLSLFTLQGPFSPLPSLPAGSILSLCCKRQGRLSPVDPKLLGSCCREQRNGQ